MKWLYILHPDFEKKYFFQLHICKTRKRYDAIRAQFNFKTTGTQACFIGNWIGKKYKKSRPLGAIAIDMTTITDRFNLSNVIAHECVHAAAHYMRRCRTWKKVGKEVTKNFRKEAEQQNDPERMPEEQLAYAVGRLTAQVTRALKQDRKFK